MLKNSKLFAVWQLLSRIEQRELGRWLAYDTVRDDVNRLYALLVAAREVKVMIKTKFLNGCTLMRRITTIGCDTLFRS